MASHISMGADIGAGDTIDRNDDFAIDAQGTMCVRQQ